MYNKLNKKARIDFNNYIKENVNKDRCEFCSSKDNLEVHHKEPLSVTTKKVIEQYKDIKDTSALSHIVNSKSIQKGFLTLCSKCHLELHKENDDFGRLSADTRVVNRIKREKKHLVVVEKKLKELYDDKVVFLDKNSREPLIKFINYREDGKLRKSISKLNGFLERRKSSYRIKTVNTTKNGKRYGSAWKIIKVN